MTRRVYKYLLPGPGSRAAVSMPIGAAVVHVAVQGRGLFAWAEVEFGAPSADHEFAVLPTGYDVPDDMTHIGTVMDGPYVWHVYGETVERAAIAEAGGAS